MGKMLEKTEELSLARAWLEDGDKEARARLVTAYKPMISSMARGYVRNGISHDDLFQEGSIGFLAALDNFDPSRGYGVGTLARFHVASRMQLYVAEFTGTIRLPNSKRMKSLLSTCVGLVRYVESLHIGPIPSELKAKLCEAAGFSLDELEQYEAVMKPSKAVGPRGGGDGDEEDTPLELADEDSDPETEMMVNDSLERSRKILAEIFSELPERTRTILSMRHLSDDFVSLDAIAAEVGVSRERVRVIERAALATVKDRLSERGINSLTDLV